MSVQYKKHFSCTSDIVSLLLDRGLIIEDVDFAQRYIDRVGYYRLSGYLYPMLRFPKENHSFKSGSKFQNAINLYRFDKKFRFLIFYEIEKIEGKQFENYITDSVISNLSKQGKRIDNFL